LCTKEKENTVSGNTVESVLNTSLVQPPYPSHEMQSFFSPNWLNYRLPSSSRIGL